ncbi:hypothetical protein GGI12_004775, partial [Dipsacomyces acuminosporus]
GIPDGAYIVKSLNVTRDIKPTSVAKRDHGDFHRTGGGKQWCKPFTGNRAFYCWGPSRCEATIVNGYTSTETWNGDAKVQLGSLQAGLGYSSSHSVNVQTNYKADQGPGECCTWAMTPEMAWICGWKEGSCIFAPGWGAPPICEKDSDDFSDAHTADHTLRNAADVCHEKLCAYYSLTGARPFAVATILDPCTKLEFYRRNVWEAEWVDDTKKSVESAFAEYDCSESASSLTFSTPDPLPSTSSVLARAFKRARLSCIGSDRTLVASTWHSRHPRMLFGANIAASEKEPRHQRQNQGLQH